jgi:aminoglycoside phosphotransferase (APT) family kinase protein
MESSSKIKLDGASLARICERWMGKAPARTEELGEGWFNTIHALEFADGQRAVIKISPSPSFQPMRYEEGIIETEVAVLRLLSERGLAAPRVLVDRPSGEGVGHHWFIMERLEGRAWRSLRGELGEADRDRIDSAVGEQCARVNAIAGPRFGRYREDGCASASWAESFLSMASDLLADARDRSVGLPWPEARLRAAFEGGREALGLVTEPRLVLWDLHDGNVIAGGEPPGLQGFIDCDRALWGDPLMEFYFRSGFPPSAAWGEGYRRACAAAGLNHPADARGAAERIALYDLYLALVMVVEVAYRGFGPDHEAWVRGELDKVLLRF